MPRAFVKEVCKNRILASLFAAITDKVLTLIQVGFRQQFWWKWGNVSSKKQKMQ